MKAIAWTAYGSPDVLRVHEVDRPTPKDNDVLVRVRATTVTAGDTEVRSLKFPPYLALPIRLYMGVLKPRGNRTLGQELAGVVEAVGSNVTQFHPGDAVFGTTGMNFGGYAEYAAVPANGEGVLALKPDGISFEEAAAVPTAGLEALHFMRLAKIQTGQSVLINGAGGSIGTFAVQLAKHFGAEVTAVDRGEKLDMLRSIGADHVLDYTREDFTRSGKTYDAIFDVMGKASFAGSVRALKPGGRYLLGNAGIRQRIRGAWLSGRGDKKVITANGGQKPEDLNYLKTLIEAGHVRVVIDRSYPLEQMAEAHHYVESGAKQGHVVITVGADD